MADNLMEIVIDIEKKARDNAASKVNSKPKKAAEAEDHDEVEELVDDLLKLLDTWDDTDHEYYKDLDQLLERYSDEEEEEEEEE